jgi:Transposase
MKRIPRRTFNTEFKAEAAKLVTEQKLTHAEASQKLDIATKSLRTWIDQQAPWYDLFRLGKKQIAPGELFLGSVFSLGEARLLICSGILAHESAHIVVMIS